MNQKEEIRIMWQIDNLLRDLRSLLNRKYFDQFLEMDENERKQAYCNEWRLKEYE